MKVKVVFLLFGLCFLFWQCSETLRGNLLNNKSPETYCQVDTIIRFGYDRFKTQINVGWWGDDPDGFVKGFEISTDRISWQFTSKMDSNFIVSIPNSQDTFDFVLYIRAIDNEGLADATPARISYPVRNSPPTVQFEYNPGTAAVYSKYPLRSFPVLKFKWLADDPDGNDNLDYCELYLNDTNSVPCKVDALYSSVVLQAADIVQDISDCRVLQGNSYVLNDSKLPGLKYNDSNQLILRAVDKVGEKSSFTYSRKVYVRKPSSKILLVNAYSTGQSMLARENEYVSWLNQCGIATFDIVRLNEVVNFNYTELAPDNYTQSKIFELFDIIIWFGKNISYSMSLAQRTTEGFFAQGGKMFMAVEIAADIDPQAGYLGFTPIDSLVSLPAGVNGFRINKGAIVMPIISGWPVLKSDTNTILPSTRPFYENLKSLPLYNAEIIKSTSSGQSLWTGKSTIMAKKVEDGKTTFIISSVELHNLNGNNNIVQFFDKILRVELGI